MSGNFSRMIEASKHSPPDDGSDGYEIYGLETEFEAPIMDVPKPRRVLMAKIIKTNPETVETNKEE